MGDLSSVQPPYRRTVRVGQRAPRYRRSASLGELCGARGPTAGYGALPFLWGGTDCDDPPPRAWAGGSAYPWVRPGPFRRLDSVRLRGRRRGAGTVLPVGARPRAGQPCSPALVGVRRGGRRSTDGAAHPQPRRGTRAGARNTPSAIG